MSANAALIEMLDAELPQTQCGKCGHPGCRPYAEGIAAGDEAINKCPPGGEATVARLAELTGQPRQPLAQPAESPKVAYIREAECIGCTKCIQACPVDAILGAAKQMHTVIAGECTGCELCVAPCPVDCIDILPHPEWVAARTQAQQDTYLAKRAELGRQRYEARQQRLDRQAEEKRRKRERRQAAVAAKTKRETAPAQPTQQDAAASVDTTSLKATRATLVAGLKRVERQRQRDGLDPEARRALDERAETLTSRLADVDRQLGNAQAPRADSSTTHHRRMAVKAAEQSLRKARQQVTHAQRHGDAASLEAAHSQVDEAQRMLDTARSALDSPSST
ncbi:RnfABCDGE type electron transport complex subunit B [Chromohalobacter canadensis]|uniref:RnfABCDGE type electron transport complex subunit B n=1 Tax=Chromohalobacter canadensis TaxID=141389 RepID=A0ABZ0YBR0_9GAMM|nr:RnfABCDGE type electron transport complex subunit B [Chromohalobacter canadensis]MCK0769076.1 RnfABCDGE type electron transport complex subunit B [Chromohalobacter canadensis]WQH09366.1 RnfABCDGE type electron transport complex subunit B [Chromohalobacter canadensis]